MTSPAFPARAGVTVCFAHVAYQFANAFARRESDIAHFQCWSLEDFMERAGEADVIITSGFWRNELLESELLRQHRGANVYSLFFGHHGFQAPAHPGFIVCP